MVTALWLSFAATMSAVAASKPEVRLPSFTNSAGSKMPCGSCAPPAELRAETEIARPGEPGERLKISGTIYQADGATPAEGIILFLYHTDATGYYNKEDDAFNPRLRGWVKTGKDGRYAFQTIKPGPYPGRDTPAHIHVHLFSASIPEHSIDEYRLDDDPRVSAKEREEGRAKGHFSPVVRLTHAKNGTWEGVRDIKL